MGLSMAEASEVAETAPSATAVTQEQPVIETPVAGAGEGDTPTGGALPTEAKPKSEISPGLRKRFAELTNERHQERAGREAAEADRTRLQAELEALRSGSQQVNPTTGHQGTADVMTLATQIAEQRIVQREFTQKVDTIYQAGKGEFSDFDQAVDNLALASGDQRRSAELLKIAAELPDTHKVLYWLGKDENFDEAARIAALPATKMAIELTRLSGTVGKSLAKPVSNAPAPITPVDGSSAPIEKDPEKMSTDEWMAWRNKTATSRRDRRRS